MQKLKSSLNESLNQRLQAKYPHLELAVLPLSQVNKDNESKRIDSEYFKKEYLENENVLLNLDSVKLENFIAKMTGGATPLGATYLDSGVSFLRVQNIMQNYFNLNDIVYISHADDENLKRSRLKLGDMLLTITGAYGKAAVVEQNLIGANINQHSVKIETKDINPYFLATFINSKYGQLQCDKKITGVTRPALDYQVIRNFLIPQFSQDFQLEIEKLVKDSHKALEDSKTLYKEAENLLYESLGLDSVNPLESLQKFTHPLAPSAREGEQKDISQSPLPQHEGHLGVGSTCDDNVLDCHADKSARNDENSPYLTGGHNISSPSLAEGARGWVNTHNDDIATKYPHLDISIRQLSQSYGKSGRLDSEYYQSKYDAIECIIKDYKGGWDYVKAFFSHNDTTCDFSKDKYNYIEIGDINTSNGTASYNQIQTDELPANAKIAIVKNDILISKVRPYRGAVAIIDFDTQDTIASGAFVVLRENSDFKKEVLQVLLRTVIYKEWLLKWNVGTSYPVIKDEDILNLPIPKIDSTTQKRIAFKIQKSFALRKVAKDLLESAKSKVERAIDSK